MKRHTRCGLSLLLVLAMCISLLAGMTFAATPTVDYVTKNGYILNWGSRGTTATYLSPNAEQFYNDNGTSYGELADLAGTGTALYDELQELMVSNHDHETTYKETRDLYRYTDCQNSSDTGISSFYSGKTIGPAWDSGATWNREHTWPDSKGLNGADEDDIMMLRPTAGSENSARGNKAYGESTGYYDPNSVSGGTYDLHGDVARIVLYVYVRWGNGNLWGTNGVMESKEVLLQWMQEDPVDTWELGRNDAVESITGTRNVFVDYPELAFLLFNEAVPGNMTTPSGEAVNAGSEYKIDAVSGNADHGTVSVSGNVINAFPVAGYSVSGYEVISGSAQVTRNGNAFTVAASSDCTIRINFEARTDVTVRFAQNGTFVSKDTVYTGDSITLPGHSGDAPAGHTFVGWVTGTVSDATTQPETVYAPGSSYTADASATLYALYSRVDSQGSGAGMYELFTGDVEEGDYLIVSDGGALKASVSSKKRFDFSKVTIANGTIMNPGEDIVWHIVPTSDGRYTIYNESVGKYAGGSGTKNQGALLSSVTDYAKWTISANRVMENVGNKAKGVNYTLRRNADYGFACYASATGTGMTLYKAVTGTVYYTTGNELVCTHQDTIQVPQQDPTENESGYTAGVYCNDCEKFISGHEEIPAQRIVTFSVPAGVEQIESVVFTGTSIKLPAAGVPDGDVAYTFLGWAEQPVDHADTKPDIVFKADSMYWPNKNVTLYALYSYEVEGTGSGASTWQLVTDASTLSAGSQIVIAANSKGLVAGDISGKYMVHKSAEFAEDRNSILSLPEGAVVLTLGGSVGAWTLTNADGKLLGSNANKSVKWNQGTTTWSITIQNGNATIQNGTSGNGRFLYNVNSPRFTTYTSATNSNMLLPQIYMLASGSSVATYYTTVIGEACTHEGTTELRGQSDATCTVDGYTGDVWCTNCKTQISTGTVAPATGHASATYKEQIDSTCKTAGVKAHYHCNVCGQDILEKTVEAAPQTAEDLALPLDAENHEGGTELRGQVDAGCEAGYTGDVCCLGCDAVLEAGQSIPAEHSYGDFSSDQDGHWKECACGSKAEEGEHTYGEWVTVKPAGQGVDGVKERACTACGYKQTNVIPAEPIPETGDNGQMVLWLLVLIPMACLAMIVPVYNKKKA